MAKLLNSFTIAFVTLLIFTVQLANAKNDAGIFFLHKVKRSPTFGLKDVHLNGVGISGKKDLAHRFYIGGETELTLNSNQNDFSLSPRFGYQHPLNWGENKKFVVGPFLGLKSGKENLGNDYEYFLNLGIGVDLKTILNDSFSFNFELFTGKNVANKTHFDGVNSSRTKNSYSSVALDLNISPFSDKTHYIFLGSKILNEYSKDESQRDRVDSIYEFNTKIGYGKLF